MLRDLEICILECDGEAIEGFKDAADFNLGCDGHGLKGVLAYGIEGRRWHQELDMIYTFFSLFIIILFKKKPRRREQTTRVTPGT